MLASRKVSIKALEIHISFPSAHLQRANARSIHMIWHLRTIGEHLHWSVPKGNTPVLSKVLEC